MSHSFATSDDGTEIAWEHSGTGATALVFVHGWLGNRRWWDAQRDALKDTYSVVQLDLAGHGGSGQRRVPTIAAYAADVAAVVRSLPHERVVLIGHSMSGAVVTEASLHLPNVAALIYVDTLKNVEASPSPAQVEEMLALYRNDFRTAIEEVAPKWLYGPRTPAVVRDRLTREFLAASGDTAAALLEPLYAYDTLSAAKRVTVPVRALNSDLHPTDREANRRHFRDFDVRMLEGVGHYPMLEVPEEFTAALRETLAELHLLPLAAYLNHYFVDKATCASLAKVSMERLDALIAAGAVPGPTYSCDGGSISSSVFGTIEIPDALTGAYFRPECARWVALADKAPAGAEKSSVVNALEAELRAALKADRTLRSESDSAIEARIQDYLPAFFDGTFGLCAADPASGAGIVRKELLQERLTALTGNGTNVTPEGITQRQLLQLIDDYAAAAMPFSPVEYERSSRRRLVDKLRLLMR